MHALADRDGIAASAAEWLLDWFRGRGASLPERDVALELNFFESGWIDSLGVIELIVSVEERFAIRFTEQHFQERRFVTTRGLAAIIGELAEVHEHAGRRAP